MSSPRLPDERGKCWLQAKTEQILAASAITLATPHSESDPACYWGTSLETSTTLYLRLAGDLEPKALHFPRTVITNCGAGRYFSQQSATVFIRRMLKKMGIVSA
jgi:hypothetical protein